MGDFRAPSRQCSGPPSRRRAGQGFNERRGRHGRSRDEESIHSLDKPGVFARYLAAKGDGDHRIAVAAPNFDDTVAEQLYRGNTLPVSGSVIGLNIAYFLTDHKLEDRITAKMQGKAVA